MNLNHLTRGSWQRIADIVRIRDHECCQYCGAHIPSGEPDHILPLIKGGTDSLDNLVWSCASCNREKNDKTIYEWFLHVRNNYVRETADTQNQELIIEEQAKDKAQIVHTPTVYVAPNSRKAATIWLEQHMEPNVEYKQVDIMTAIASTMFSEGVINWAKRNLHVVSIRHGHNWYWIRQQEDTQP